MPQYSAKESIEFDLTYSCMIKLSLRLVVMEYDKDTKTHSVVDVKEENNVFFCELPIPDELGLFNNKCNKKSYCISNA